MAGPVNPPRLPVGRGATSNPAPRFLAHATLAFDDGWGSLDGPDATSGPAPPRLATTLRPEKTRSIIARNDSPDVPFDASVNPYKGCEHGCIYCFARPSHAYLDLSPGLDFESQIVWKPEAALRLRAALSRPSYRPEVIALGANTDPYQPVERTLGLTRQLLEVFLEHRHPVSIVTKSNLVLRDLDLLAELARLDLATVFISVTTLDPGLSRRMEPRAPTPERRLSAIASLHEAGVPVGVLASPIIPAINDHEIERILEAARGAGAAYAGTILVRLPYELKELFEGWLATHFPDRKEHVLHLIREARGGQLYDATFGDRMRGAGPYADLLQRRFRLARERLGFLDRTVPLRTDLFCRPAPVEPPPSPQLDLFAIRRR
jgi:DNA repair photolyase